jgi:uncharacterized membrane protein YgcG
MPHRPGHQSPNTYTVAGSNTKYTGNVVEAGGKLYTTTGNTLEVNSLLLVEAPPSNVNNRTPNPINDNPVIATFVRGDGSQFDRTYYLPLNYSGQYGNAGGSVNSGTPLHRHQDRTTMLEHNMDNPVIVTTTRPRTNTTRGGVSGRQATPTRQNRRGSTLSSGQTVRRATPRNMTSGGGMNRGGGGRSGGY